MNNSATIWNTAPATPTLVTGEVQIWRTTLDAPEETIQRLHRLLTPDEQQRAARFHFQKDRNHYTVARGVLRLILGRYLNCAPELLRFTYTSHGKPDLSPDSGGDWLAFNLSHSGTMALYGITLKRRIGVDIEYIRPDTASAEIAERFFSAREVAALRALPVAVQHEAFFNCWTRKEAYIKAIGEGLSHPLDKFVVSLAPGEPARLLETMPDPEEAARWTFQALDVAPGYKAALAVEGPISQLHCWNSPI